MADLLDPRQRLAAALCLSAIDLPAEIAAWAHQGLEAASVCPGLTVDQLRLNSRREALLRARELLDQLISEASAP